MTGFKAFPRTDTDIYFTRGIEGGPEPQTDTWGEALYCRL